MSLVQMWLRCQKKVSTIQDGHRKWGTHARVFSQTLAPGKKQLSGPFNRMVYDIQLKYAQNSCLNLLFNQTCDLSNLCFETIVRLTSSRVTPFLISAVGCLLSFSG